jgi:hypothetical protein
VTGTQDTVSVEIRALVDKFIADLKSAGGAAGDAGREIGDGLKRVGSGAAEAHGPFSSFTGVLKEYRSEMRQEARLGRFLAADIASMGIASKSAAGEITQFIGAFAIGGGLGVAIESVKLLVHKVTEVSHEEDAAREALKKYSDDGVANIAKLIRANEDLLKKKRAVRLEEVVGPLAADAAAIQTKLAKAQDDYADAVVRAYGQIHGSKLKDIDATTLEEALTKKQKDAVDELNVALQKQNALIGIAKDAVKDEFRKLDILRHRKEHEEAISAERAYQRDILIEEHVADVALVARDAEKLQKARDQEQAELAISLATQEQLDNLEREVSFEGTNVGLLWQKAEAEQEAADALAAQKKDWQALSPVAHAVGNAITQMAFDGKSLDDTLKSVARQLADAAIQFAIKALLTGGTGGAGGLLASIFSFEHGGDVPSAAAGWDVPSASGAIPAVLHPREMVLPEKYADVIRGAAAGGDGGGVHLHFHGDVYDAGGVRALPSHPEFAKGLREARRMGRIP